MTQAEFLQRYPEFRTDVDTGSIVSALQEAELFTSDNWGDVRDSVIALKAAIILCRSSKGRNVRSTDGSTTYAKDLRALELAHAAILSRV